MSPNGATVASVAADMEQRSVGVILLHRVSDKKLDRKLAWPSVSIQSLAFSPNGRYLAAASGGAGFRVWNVAKGELVFENDTTCRTVVFSPDGKMIAVGGLDGRVHLCDLLGNSIRSSEQLQDEVRSVCMSPSGKYIATASSHIARIWTTADGKRLHSFDGHEASISAITVAPDGTEIFTTSLDATLRVWNTERFTTVKTWDLSGGDPSSQPFRFLKAIPVAVSPDGRWLASLSGARTVRVWDRTGKKEPKLLAHDDRIEALAFLPNGGGLVTGSIMNKVSVWNLKKGRRDCEFDALMLGVGPDGKVIAIVRRPAFVGPFDIPSIQIHDAKSGKLERTFDGLGERTYAASLSFDGRTLAIAGMKNVGQVMFQVVHVSTGKVISEIRPGLLPGRACALSFDGRMLAVCLSEKKQRVYETASGLMVRDYSEALSAERICWLPRSLQFVTGHADGTALVWSLENDAKKIEQTAKLSQTELDSLWDDLVSDSASVAFKAIGVFRGFPAQSAPFLTERLKALRDFGDADADRLFRNLDSDQFTVRQKAVRDLQRWGLSARASIQKALTSNPSANKKELLEKLLSGMSKRDYVLEHLRAIRAIQALELVGTDAARKAIQCLAKEAQPAFVADPARMALARQSNVSAQAP